MKPSTTFDAPEGEADAPFVAVVTLSTGWAARIARSAGAASANARGTKCRGGGGECAGVTRRFALSKGMKPHRMHDWPSIVAVASMYGSSGLSSVTRWRDKCMGEAFGGSPPSSPSGKNQAPERSAAAVTERQ